MKRRISLLLLALMLLTLPVRAAGEGLLVDGAGLLHGSEKAALTEKAEAIFDEYQFDAVIVTMDTIGGGDPLAWANSYYDNNGYGYGPDGDGMMLLLVMDTREWAISTCGKGIACFPSYVQDAMIDAILDDLSAGDYYGAFDRWLEECGAYLAEPVYSGDSGYDPGYDSDYDYDYDYDYGYDPQPNYFLRVVVSVGLGFLLSMIPMGMMKKEIRNVGSKSGAAEYTRPGSMNLTTRHDRFLYTHTNRVRRAQNNSSGGRSGGHHSSGGRSHGGSRGRF